MFYIIFSDMIRGELRHTMELVMPVSYTHTQGEKTLRLEGGCCHVVPDSREARAKLTSTHQFELRWGQQLLLVTGIC